MSKIKLVCPTERKIVTGDFYNYGKFTPARKCRCLEIPRIDWIKRPEKRFKWCGQNVLTHNGLDMRAYWGEPILAAHNGTVVVAEDDWTGYKGFCIVIKYDANVPEYKALFSLYAHLEKANKRNIREGSRVQAGEIIGYSGCKGKDHPYASHLHFELRARTSACSLSKNLHGYEEPETLIYLNPALHITEELAGT
ncbi:MAG: M23 family metallopeptidase [Spirochaetota bacterium]